MVLVVAKSGLCWEALSVRMQKCFLGALRSGLAFHHTAGAQVLVVPVCGLLRDAQAVAVHPHPEAVAAVRNQQVPAPRLAAEARDTSAARGAAPARRGSPSQRVATHEITLKVHRCHYLKKQIHH